LIGALPPGAMHPYAAPPVAFPGPPMLTPMMHPRFRWSGLLGGLWLLWSGGP